MADYFSYTTSPSFLETTAWLAQGQGDLKWKVKDLSPYSDQKYGDAGGEAHLCSNSLSFFKAINVSIGIENPLGAVWLPY